MFRTARVNLYTRDIEAGLHFYRDLLSFEETLRTLVSKRLVSGPAAGTTGR